MAKKNLPSRLKLLWQVGWFGLRHPVQLLTLARVRRRHLTYLGWDALIDLSQAVWQVEQQAVAGSLIEAGCALGGSAITLAAARRQKRPLQIYDTFEGMPPPSERDGEDVHQRYQKIQAGKIAGIGDQTYYGYLDNLQAQVHQNFVSAGIVPEASQVTFVPGLFEESLRPAGPVALAHIDCDWYDSVRVCLERIVPLLPVGGILVIDDYQDWSGCRRAVDDYFADRRAHFTFTLRSRLHICRVS